MCSASSTELEQTLQDLCPGDDIEQILALRTFRDFGGGGFYNDSFGFLDQNPHNTMHIWTGGINPDYQPTDADPTSEPDGNRNRGVRVAGRRFHTRADMYEQPQYGDMLSNLTASYDPVFWPIHFNVDRLWAEWQQLKPAVAAAGPRLGAHAVELHDRRHARSPALRLRVREVLLPDPGRPGDARRPLRLAADRRPRGRARRVPPGGGADCTGFPQLPRSCFIRVFLNLADADASTPIDDEHYAGTWRSSATAPTTWPVFPDSSRIPAVILGRS
ncbi:MAG: tyrosinase family protein [Gammaproteobacteria bacterium]